MSKRTKAKRTRYTDEFRASAVAAVIAAGYPSIKGALTRVASEFGISHQVLRDWTISNHNPPPQDLLQEKKKDLRDLFLDEIYEAAGVLPTKRGAAGYQQLVTAMATLYDKVRLIDNLPTAIIGIMPEFIEAATRRGHDPLEIMRAVINELHIEVEAENTGGDEQND